MATRRFTVEILGDSKSVEKAVAKTNAALGTVNKSADRSSREFHGFGLQLDKVAGGFSKLLGVLGKVGVLGVATTAVHALAGSALQLVGAALQASGALVALPAAGLALAAVFGTVALATHGMGDAFKAVGSGDAKALDAALKGLAPNARKFVQAISAAKPAFDKMRLDVQNKLFAGFAGQVKTLAEEYLPKLRLRLGNIASTLNTGALDIAKAIGNPRAAAAMQDVLRAANNALRALLPVIAPVVAAFASIASVGSGALPGIAQSLAGVAQKFAAFIQTAAKSGALKNFMDVGIAVAKELGHVLGDVGKILNDVFTAAGDSAGDVFGTIGQLLDGVHEFLSSTTGQNALLTFFTSAHDLLGAFMPLLKTLATTVGTVVAPALAQIGKALLPGLTAIAQGLGPILADLAPHLTAVFKTIGAALPSLIPGLTALGDAIGKGLTALAPAFGPLLDAISAIVVAIAPLLPMAATLFAKLLVAAAPVVTKLAIALAPVIAQLIRDLAPILPRLATDFAALLVALSPVIQAFAVELLPVLPQLIDSSLRMVEALLPMMPIFTNLLTVLAPVIADTLRLQIAFHNLQAKGISLIVEGLKFLAKIFFDTVGVIVTGAAKAFGWVPGVGDKLKLASEEFKNFKKHVNDSLNGIVSRKVVTLSIVEKTTVIGSGHGSGATGAASVRAFASGGPFLPGLALVGEQGPELVQFTGAGRVTPASETRQILAGAAAGATTINVYVTGSNATPADIGRELAWAMRTGR